LSLIGASGLSMWAKRVPPKGKGGVLQGQACSGGAQQPRALRGGVLVGSRAGLGHTLLTLVLFLPAF